MSNSTADALCQISSGTGITVKESADPGRDPLRLDLARPVILTTPRLGVHDWQPRPDLAHRAIAVEMPAIETPRPESDLQSEFESARPAVLATLFTSLSATLAVASPPWNRPPGLSLRGDAHRLRRLRPLFAPIKSLSNWTGTASDLCE